MVWFNKLPFGSVILSTNKFGFDIKKFILYKNKLSFWLWIDNFWFNYVQFVVLPIFIFWIWLSKKNQKKNCLYNFFWIFRISLLFNDLVGDVVGDSVNVNDFAEWQMTWHSPQPVDRKDKVAVHVCISNCSLVPVKI